MKQKLFVLFLLPVLLLQAQFNRHHFDILHADYTIDIYPEKSAVHGMAGYQIKVLDKTDSLMFDAAGNMHFKRIKINGRKVRFHLTGGKIVLYKHLKKNHPYKVCFKWHVTPSQAMYFPGWLTGGRKQVWTQGQGKNNSHWMPVIDDENEKFSWTMKIGFPDEFEVISNGKLIKKKQSGKGHTYWYYEQSKPASAYLIFIGAGKYKFLKDRSGINHIPVHNYIYAGDSLSTPTYRHFNKIFSYIEKFIGVPYPWNIYRQLPIRDFFYGGMENLTAVTFTDQILSDSISLNDYNPDNVLAHELAHHWFGDYVTETGPKHHWIHESFATFLAREAEKDIYGKNYYDWKNHLEKKRIISAFRHGDTVPLLNGKASSLTFYQKGATILRMMRNKLGAEKFRKVLQDFLKHHAYGNVNTSDFKASLFRITGDSLNGFFRRWFETAEIPSYNISISNDSLILTGTAHNPPLRIRLYYTGSRHIDMQFDGPQKLPRFRDFIGYIPAPGDAHLYDIQWEIDTSKIKTLLDIPKSFIDQYRLLEKIPQEYVVNHFKYFAGILRKDTYFPIHTLIARKLRKASDSLHLQASLILLRKGLTERQQAAFLVGKIPEKYKASFEILLNDSSYVTRETALEKLWFNFPAERSVYLDKTAHITGDNSRHFWMTWLILALNTRNYGTANGNKKKFLEELIDYASPAWPVQVRRNAFDWIERLQIKTPEVKQYLDQASTYFHPGLARQARRIRKKLFGN